MMIQRISIGPTPACVSGKNQSYPPYGLEATKRSDRFHLSQRADIKQRYPLAANLDQLVRLQFRYAVCHSLAIHAELEKIKGGAWSRTDNPLKNAPHTALELAGDWPHAYSREQAVFPAPWLRAAKYWPPVKRIDNAAGDRNLVCTCPPMEAYA